MILNKFANKHHGLQLLEVHIWQHFATYLFHLEPYKNDRESQPLVGKTFPRHKNTSTDSRRDRHLFLLGGTSAWLAGESRK